MKLTAVSLLLLDVESELGKLSLAQDYRSIYSCFPLVLGWFPFVVVVFPFFLMWTILKDFIEFFTTLFLFYVLISCPQGLGDLSSLTRD